MKQNCANQKCPNRISSYAVLCWDCLKRLPEAIRTDYQDAHAAMQCTRTPGNIAAYRAARDTAVTTANAA